MKRIVTFALLVLPISLACADDNIVEISRERVRQALDQANASHPRLFLNDQSLDGVMRKIKASDELAVLHEAIGRQADQTLQQKPLERIQTGRRLLGVSREALKRLLNLSWAYRTSGDEKYLKRAEQEMLAIAEFSDWNPSHFLDVAEMTTALAIGYDWLYNDLSAESREKIRRAIVEKGLRPSLYENQKPEWWISTTNNWNQVCHGGLTCGALAVMDAEPKLAETIIHRAVNQIQVAMHEYGPDGAYPEGPSYWVYGTTYNVLFLAALDSVIGDDFGLSQKTGFANSAAYYLHVTGPSGLYFNYPDCGQRAGLIPAVFWFAEKYHSPAIAWNQQQLLKNAGRNNASELTSDRTAALALIWANADTAWPQALSWMGRSVNPVAMFRSAWQPDATYLAIKGGTPSSSHAHMDIGSFVIDADGLRWAVDLGMEDYNKIEQLGMNLWDSSQNGDRWTIFRYGNFAHSTLTVNGQLQRVKGFAPMIRYSAAREFPHAVIDMTDVYKGQLERAVRGASLLPSGQILIQDELQATDQPATVRWSMVTPAKVDIRSGKTAVLTRQDKTMQFRVVTQADVKLATYSTEPRADYDATNGDTRMIGFDIALAANENLTVQVILVPGSENKPIEFGIKDVESWSPPLTVPTGK